MRYLGRSVSEDATVGDIFPSTACSNAYRDGVNGRDRGTCIRPPSRGRRRPSPTKRERLNHHSKQGYKMQHLCQKRMDIRVYRRGGLEQARGGPSKNVFGATMRWRRAREQRPMKMLIALQANCTRLGVLIGDPLNLKGGSRWRCPNKHH